MRAFTLQRVRSTSFASYGHLIDDTGAQVCCTLELPWRNNAPDISCIPAGTYTVRRRYSTAHGRELFWIDDVPGRGAVEMHIGCLPRDTKGCVLVGAAFGWVDYADGKPGASGDGITGSHAAFDRFMNLLEDVGEFRLTIIDAAPPTALAA